jgi:hypothetical protein
MQFWNELEGQVLDGYPLRRLVRSEGRSAWFETEVPEEGNRPATISLTESLTDADEVTERLQTARQIQHPNLVAISKVGQARLDRALFVYAVMERTDQNLADVLRQQCLSTREAHQIAEAMVGALTEIHQRKLVHGRVEPASIVAIGEEVKLRSDCLQHPGGTRAEDVAGIGATLFQAFTQRQPSSADDTQINRIPAPFAEIIRNSLSSRWSLAQVAAVLRPPAIPTPTGTSGERPTAPVKPPVRPPSPPVDVAQPKPVKEVAQPTSQKEPARDSVPLTVPARMAPQRPRPVENQSESKSRPILLYAGVAFVLLLILCWLIFRPKSHEPASAAPPRAANPGTAATTNPPNAQSQTESSLPPATPGAQRTKPSAVHSSLRQLPGEAAPSGPSAEPGTRAVWRVVVYTYRRQDQAQNKADALNSAHSDLQASVFSPKGGGTYLVIVGGAMDHSHAIAMRDKARGEGLPPDTYAQNFAQ